MFEKGNCINAGQPLVFEQLEALTPKGRGQNQAYPSSPSKVGYRRIKNGQATLYRWLFRFIIGDNVRDVIRYLRLNVRANNPTYLVLLTLNVIVGGLNDVSLLLPDELSRHIVAH